MLPAAVLILRGVRMVVWAVGWDGCALYYKLWFVSRQVGLVIVSVLGRCLWSLGLSRTAGELFVRLWCVIYGRSSLVYKSNGQTGLPALLIALVSKFGFQVSDFISTVSGLRFHDGHLRFHESDFLRPPVSFSFP